LQAVVQLVQQLRDQFMADRMPAPREGLRQLPGTLTRVLYFSGRIDRPVAEPRAGE
jgi:hypothetical protein